VPLKSALICGIGGQDGAYLARLLIHKGYRILGTSRDAQGVSLANLYRLRVGEQIVVLFMVPEDFRSVLMVIKAV
jgi:GDPmannose 4,6-dehydratase